MFQAFQLGGVDGGLGALGFADSGDAVGGEGCGLGDDDVEFVAAAVFPAGEFGRAYGGGGAAERVGVRVLEAPLPREVFEVGP